MTAGQLWGVVQALDQLLARDLPVAVAIPAAAARKAAAEVYQPYGLRVREIRAEIVGPADDIPEAQMPIFEAEANKVLAEEAEADLPTVTVPPMLMLPGAVVAVLVEAGVLEVAS